MYFGFLLGFRARGAVNGSKAVGSVKENPPPALVSALGHHLSLVPEEGGAAEGGAAAGPEPPSELIGWAAGVGFDVGGGAIT